MSKKLARDSLKLSKMGTGTTGKYKQFSPEAYRVHDGPAVGAVLEHLDSIQVWAAPNDNKYGPDIVVWEGLRPHHYIEVEQRSGWSSGPFPQAWNPIHIPERKGKYFSLGLSFEIWILSMDLKFGLIVPDYSIQEHGELKEFSNAKIREGELFYHVDLEHCIDIELSRED